MSSKFCPSGNDETGTDITLSAVLVLSTGKGEQELSMLSSGVAPNRAVQVKQEVRIKSLRFIVKNYSLCQC